MNHRHRAQPGADEKPTRPAAGRRGAAGPTCCLLSSRSCFRFAFSFSSSLFLTRMGGLLPGVFLWRILAMASAQPSLAPTRAPAAPPCPRSRGSASPSLSASAASSSEERGSSSGLRIPAEPTRRNKRNFTAGGRGGRGGHRRRTGPARGVRESRSSTVSVNNEDANPPGKWYRAATVQGWRDHF